MSPVVSNNPVNPGDLLRHDGSLTPQECVALRGTCTPARPRVLVTGPGSAGRGPAHAHSRGAPAHREPAQTLGSSANSQ